MAKVKKRAVAHNSLQNLMQNYKIPFTVDGAYIDCKEMSKNFTNGLIPMTDLAKTVDAVIGPWKGRTNQYQKLFNLKPYYEDVPVDNAFSHPAFNRDTSPNHCNKLENDWFDQFAVTGLGLKMPAAYGGQVLNCDSTHTGISRIRQGVQTLPFWLADIPDQGNFDDTFALALLMAGQLFLAINVRNKRNVDIFDQHFIKVATGIYPAPQVQSVVDSVKGAHIKRAGNKIAGAVHNLNETYATFDLDKTTARPGTLLKRSLEWQIRNFKFQSIDGCLLTSFALVLQDNADCNVVWTHTEEDQLAQLLISKFNTSNNAQLKIKEACILLNKNRPGYTALDHNYVVSNGLKYLATANNIPCSPDNLQQWVQGF